MPPRPRVRTASLSELNRPQSIFSLKPVRPVDVVQPHYPHTSAFRSRTMEVNVYSASVKMSRTSAYAAANQPLPIYGDHDDIGGTITLSPSVRSTAGHITVSVEGSFLYQSASAKVVQGASSSSSNAAHRHVFFSDSAILSPVVDSVNPLSTIKDAFAATAATLRKGESLSLSSVKSGLKRRTSSHSLDASNNRIFAFNLPLPQKALTGEDLPPTFSSSNLLDGGVRGQASVERVEVSYLLVVAWEPQDEGGERDELEIPILFQPDSDFLSFDGLAVEHSSWLEIPLRAERPVPFQCAVTIPTPSIFPRFSSIPFFVVFATTPRSRTLAREIASDATITVSLLRAVTLDSSQSRRNSLTNSLSSSVTSPPSSPSDSDSTSTPPSSFHCSRNRLMKRGPRSAPPILLRSRSYKSLRELATTKQSKPLPELPVIVQDTRLLQTSVSIGFPKRPKPQTDSRGHSSIEAQASLPDGLYRGKMQLNRSMFPGLDYAGISIKYYLEVSVLFGQDEQRARVPVRIY
ncbi:hypothetical protein OF83DRAFT_1055304 [Amylostereum chailletii]|nr:hypothetical protein OF83DRAFT_1055304 [Amylostereum chailletii]